MRLFTAGGVSVKQKNVVQAYLTAGNIISLSRIPLIQGTLRYAYKVANGGDDKAKAEGAAFAAGILPSVCACNIIAAMKIYNNMRIGATSTEYTTVKRAFESTYICMGVTC